MSGKVERFRAGDVTTDSPPYRFVTTAAVTTRSGSFGPRTEKQSAFHYWSVKVYATSSKKVAAAYASRKDRYELGMTGGTELETPDWGAYMIARLRRKQFSWGHAVSFFSQFTQDNALYVPHNGHLTYEVWGVTPDQKFTVVAQVSVSHPQLADWGRGVRGAPTMKALKRDRDYRRVERCSPEEFVPSLTEFDRMLDSIVIR